MHRSDGSGTTFIFTNYLSKVSPDWKSNVGSNTSVEWPAGIGAKGNEGVANNVAQTKGAIGYVETAYAKQNKLTTMKMVNKDGKVVAATPEAIMSSASRADWANAPGFYMILTDEAGRRVLADRRCHVHPRAHGAEGLLPQPMRRSNSSNGRTRTAMKWPAASITSPCRTMSSN